MFIFNLLVYFERDADIHIFRSREQNFDQYIGIKLDPDTSNIIHVSRFLKDKAVRYQIFHYKGYFDERKRHKQQLVKRIDRVVADIEKELRK